MHINVCMCIVFNLCINVHSVSSANDEKCIVQLTTAGMYQEVYGSNFKLGCLGMFVMATGT